MTFLDLPYESDRFLYAAVGDVHGDLATLTAAVDLVRERAAATGRTAAIVLLGDLVDRGPDSAGCAAFAMRLANGLDPERPDVRVHLVRGDHEDALSYDADADAFRSYVIPCEWCERLATLPPDDPERALAREFIVFAHAAPAAIRFSSGILCAHGGVPHSDLLPRLASTADLAAPECARDFLWCRVSGARRKFPNRATLGCQIGREDIAAFLDRLDGFPVEGEENVAPVRLFVRGHDHAPDGHTAIPLREGRGVVHTVTTFCNDDPFPGPQRAAVLLLPDDPATGEPEVVPIPGPERARLRFRHPFAARSTPPCPCGASPLSEGGFPLVLPPSERGVAQSAGGSTPGRIQGRDRGCAQPEPESVPSAGEPEAGP